MARISTVIATSHSPFMFEPVQWWTATRDARRYAPDVPVDDDGQNRLKRRRIEAGFAALHDIVRQARPDVMVVFGDDQSEQFDLRNHPAFAVYVGGRFHGYKAVRYAGPLGSREWKPKTAEHWAGVDTRPDLARELLYGLMDAGVDPAFMTALPDEDVGMGHAFMRPAGPLTGGRFDIPMVPVLVNCLYAPQPTAARCVQVARVVRDVIARWPADLSVAVVGSGGLWHTPGSADAYLDEAFDRAVLAHVRSGDADALARYFDGWAPAPERASLACFRSFDGGSRMRSGVGSGVGETRNWIMAAAVADRPGVVIDYIPVYASPCGIGFAHWIMD